LWLNTRAEILAGGVSGPAVVPGASKDSLLFQRVSGTKPPLMPVGGKRLDEAELGILRAWIDQGAKAEEPPPPAKWVAPLAPRRPSLPEAAAAQGNIIDAYLDAYLRRMRLTRAAPVSDEGFLRRASFDLWGLPASPEQRKAFLADARPDKRARLVDTLLAARRHFSEHWISFWNDLLHNDEGVTYIGDRKTITPWLRKALESDMPYDRMVQALLNPSGPDDPEGFVLGVNWRGDVSASQRPVIQAAQNSAQVFLGVNLKCNACHDSFISSWKLKDAYGLASFFADERLEIVRCDVRTGEMASPKFLYPQLGSVAPEATLAERRQAVASLFTKRENGRFARTFVNRVWERLFGRGFIKPADEMDAEPWDADLLDWLAHEFATQGFDIDWLLRQIMTSRAYQLPAVTSRGGEEKSYVFRGPHYRRLSAEQFADAVSAVTGEWRVLGSAKPEPGEYAREWRFKASPLSRALGRPQRDLAVTERNNDPATLQMLELVNGRTLAGLLHRGSQRMLGVLPASPPNLFESGVVSSNKAAVDVDISGARELRLLAVDYDSYDAARVVAGWADAVLEGPGVTERLAHDGTLQFRGDQARPALIAKIPSEHVFPLAGKGFTRFRATVGADQSVLRSDINPRVRFYVFAGKPDLEQLGRVVGDPPLPFIKQRWTAGGLVSRVYTHALGREPSAEERKAALEFGLLRGSELSADGLEDLLWSVFLSPEFQYIR